MSVIWEKADDQFSNSDVADAPGMEIGPLTEPKLNSSPRIDLWSWLAYPAETNSPRAFDMRIISTKRIYEQRSADDGFRVLADRIWPRGLAKERAGIDLWAKDIAPSTELRKWFSHDPARWDEFQRRYKAELDGKVEALRAVLDVSGDRPITLLFSARDIAHNQTTVLREVLVRLSESRSGGKRG